MNMYGSHRVALNIQDDAAPYIAVSDYLKNKPNKTIYTHHFRWPLFLRYFLKYDSSIEFRMIGNLKNKNVNKIQNAYIIFHKRYLESDIMGRPNIHPLWYTQYFDKKPPNWEKVLSFHGRPNYNSVVLYDVQ